VLLLNIQFPAKLEELKFKLVVLLTAVSAGVGE